MKNPISHEFLIQPFRQGIKLIRPERNQTTCQSVDNILKLPFSSYFMHKDIVYSCNDICAQIVDMPAYKMQNKNLQDLPLLIHSMHELIKINLDIINTHRITMTEEYVSTDENHNTFFSIKIPCYDEKSRIISIFGLSIDLQANNLAQFLKIILSLGISFHQKSIPGTFLQNVYLTQREEHIVRHLVRGKTAKEIARVMNLSPRTVEFYLINIKNKMGVVNKSDLIERCMDYFGIYC